MHSLQRIIVTGLTSMIFIAIISIYWGSANGHGELSTDSIITKYIDALERKDFEQIKKLTPANYLAIDEIQQKINFIGGCKITINNSKTEKIKPGIVSITINGICDKGDSRFLFEEKFNVQYIGGSLKDMFQGKWFLSIGSENNRQPLNIPPAKL